MWNPRGVVRRLAAFWWFAKGDLFFVKPFVDVFSILSDDYYRPGIPSKNPCNIWKILILRRDRDKNPTKIHPNRPQRQFWTKLSLVCSQFSIFFLCYNGELRTTLDKQNFIAKPTATPPAACHFSKNTFSTAFPL